MKRIRNWADAIAHCDYTRGIEAGFDAFAIELQIPQALDMWSEDGRLQKHWAHSWICTDCRVGLAVYTFDGVPVAVSSQEGRKSYENLQFISRSGADMIRTYLNNLLKPRLMDAALVDLTEPLPDYWFEKE